MVMAGANLELEMVTVRDAVFLRNCLPKQSLSPQLAPSTMKLRNRAPKVDWNKVPPQSHHSQPSPLDGLLSSSSEESGPS
ncbi:hypothetical protein G9A89_000287 [Geosiphon pyriformis]|nr:hypothetical protein G9A89_000287 [Geosiphon pyriformis]